MHKIPLPDEFASLRWAILHRPAVPPFTAVRGAVTFLTNCNALEVIEHFRWLLLHHTTYATRKRKAGPQTHGVVIKLHLMDIVSHV